jgi:uncharacterized phage-associated protein
MPLLVSHEREKLINAIIYFAQNTRYLGKVKLFKLLYLLDFEHFRMTGKSVTGLDYYAWKFGPVPVALYQEWEAPEADLRKAVRALANFDDSQFTKRELQIMQNLASQHRDAKSPDMVDLAHVENGAWAKVWNNGQGLNNLIEYRLAIGENDPNRDAILESAKEYEAIAASHQH